MNLVEGREAKRTNVHCSCKHDRTEFLHDLGQLQRPEARGLLIRPFVSLLLYEHISERMGKKSLVEINQTVPFIMIYCCYTEMDNIVKFKTVAAHTSKIIHCPEKILRNIFSAGWTSETRGKKALVQWGNQSSTVSWSRMNVVGNEVCLLLWNLKIQKNLPYIKCVSWKNTSSEDRELGSWMAMTIYFLGMRKAPHWIYIWGCKKELPNGHCWFSAM